MIVIQDDKMIEALKTMEMGLQEPVASMDIDVGVMKEPDGLTSAYSDLHETLFGDPEELE